MKKNQQQSGAGEQKVFEIQNIRGRRFTIEKRGKGYDAEFFFSSGPRKGEKLDTFNEDLQSALWNAGVPMRCYIDAMDEEEDNDPPNRFFVMRGIADRYDDVTNDLADAVESQVGKMLIHRLRDSLWGIPANTVLSIELEPVQSPGKEG